MVIGFVLVLSIIGLLLALAMYANLLPFIGLIGDIKQYNIAYYGAQSSLERALLVLRNQNPGFQGESGYSGNTFLGPKSDQNTNLGVFTSNDNSLSRQIIGRGISIPMTGEGNISQSLLSNGEKNNYNQLSYGLLDRIILGYDPTLPTNAYLYDNAYMPFFGHTISINLKTNTLINNTFGQVLDTTTDIDGDNVKDDIVLDRSWKGKYNDSGTTGDFSILPRIKQYYPENGEAEILSGDESIRESIINDGQGLNFGNIGSNEFNPIVGGSRPNSDNKSHLLISDFDGLSGISFNELLFGITSIGSLTINSQEMTLALVNPLVTENGSIYPSIEYRVQCNNCVTQNPQAQFSQPYFTINAGSKIGNYDVRMSIKKSISDESTVSLFTAIF